MDKIDIIEKTVLINEDALISLFELMQLTFPAISGPLQDIKNNTAKKLRILGEEIECQLP